MSTCLPIRPRPRHQSKRAVRRAAAPRRATQQIAEQPRPMDSVVLHLGRPNVIHGRVQQRVAPLRKAPRRPGRGGWRAGGGGGSGGGRRSGGGDGGGGVERRLDGGCRRVRAERAALRLLLDRNLVLDALVAAPIASAIISAPLLLRELVAQPNLPAAALRAALLASLDHRRPLAMRGRTFCEELVVEHGGLLSSARRDGHVLLNLDEIHLRLEHLLGELVVATALLGPEDEAAVTQPHLSSGAAVVCESRCRPSPWSHPSTTPGRRAPWWAAC